MAILRIQLVVVVLLVRGDFRLHRTTPASISEFSVR